MFKTDKVILGLLDSAETQAISDKIASIVPENFPLAIRIEWCEMIHYTYQHTLADFNRDYHPVGVKFAPGQPYDTAKQMRQAIQELNLLVISTDYNNPDTHLFGAGENGKRANLMFRTAHDLHHCMTQDCNFVLDGEICAFSKFARYALQWGKETKQTSLAWSFVRLLACEIIGQVCYLRHNGEFMPVQLTGEYVLTDNQIKRILKAYKVIQ